MSDWNKFLNEQGDKLWNEVIDEVEANDLHEALAGTRTGNIYGIHSKSVRRKATKAGNEEAKAEASVQLTQELQRHLGYHGASKTEVSNSRRTGNIILRRNRNP